MADKSLKTPPAPPLPPSPHSAIWPKKNLLVNRKRRRSFYSDYEGEHEKVGDYFLLTPKPTSQVGPGGIAEESVESGNDNENTVEHPPGTH